MGKLNEEVVSIQRGKNPGEPSVITVNCPDKTGLGCDLCRIILEFGLHITWGDISTDGGWCYVVLWAVPLPGLTNLNWESLQQRLLSVCPAYVVHIYNSLLSSSTSTSVYLLRFLFDVDVTQVLCDLELTIQRVKVMTTPDGRVMDLFFISDGLELLHTKERQEDTCRRLNSILGESCISCELESVGPEYGPFQQEVSSISPEVARELFGHESSENETFSQALTPELTRLMKADITIDNLLSPAHTLLQIHCVDQKCLLYDIMRMSKDSNIKITYCRFPSSINGYRDIDLFIQQKDGRKILIPEKLDVLCSRLRLEMLHPLRVTIASRGPDTELLVANPVELSGMGRPRVFYNVTCALKLLGICIFSAEIWRHSTSAREWEVYRFLLDENPEFPLANTQARNQIVDKM
ncbi:hypothetical protein Syun_015921 [Stephania yunnanensis]|uniref:ACT domain-containing protein ACR n=1 Tax=Stephania yunnanensis TaxID=152371 RepID=A0AAP0J434_9MAGN